METSTDDVELVRAAQGGDSRAFTALFERWFDRCHDVAWRIVRDRDTAAEVAQDVFLVVFTKIDTLRDPSAFGGWVLRAARNKALNRLDHDRRSTSIPDDDAVGLIDRGRSAADVADDVIRQEQIDLVWAASAALGERDASILDLHLRHDLSPAEIAEVLEVSPNAAHQTLFRLRRRLEGAIRSWVLWEEGHPACSSLARALEDAGVDSFGAAAVRVISAHVADCDDCTRRNAAVLAPASMFAGVPILAVAAGTREAAAAQLAAAGVPIEPALLAGSPAPGRADPDEDPNGAGGPSLAVKAVVATASVLVVLAGLVVGASLLGDGDDIDLVADAEAADLDGPVVDGTVAETPVPSTEPDAPDPGSTTEAPNLIDPPRETEPPLDTEPPVREVLPPVEPPVEEPQPETPPRTQEPVDEDAPRVVRFSVAHVGYGVCDGQRGDLYRLTWWVEHADWVALDGPNLGRETTRMPGGGADTCLPIGWEGSWTLTAQGPGGQTDATVGVP